MMQQSDTVATGPSPVIEFVNHASVLLSDGVSGVLSDPWFFGDIFHQGWSLLVETPDAEIRRVLAATTHIWVSHEHPDHFSPAFFKRYGDVIRERNISVLFQRTRDARVARYLRGLDLEVVELGDGERYRINPDFSVRIVRSDLYDSALLAEVQGVRVFNLNDCPLHSERDLTRFARRYGGCDVLLTQFSYAAWKGGRENVGWRERAARNKLAAIQRQVKALQPASCVLFASFVRFSNRLNSYMNDAVNTPDRVRQSQDEACRFVFMAPSETQPLRRLQQNPASIEFWRRQYDALATRPLTDYPQDETLDSLREAFRQFRQRLLRDNAGWLLRLVRRCLPMRPFDTTTVELIDMQQCLQIDPLGTMTPVAEGRADIRLHSSSLAYLLRHEFGFDTLFVNGCFEEASDGGFERFAKSLAIGNLNANGVKIRPASLWHLDVIRLVLKKLDTIRRNLSAK